MKPRICGELSVTMSCSGGGHSGVVASAGTSSSAAILITSSAAIDIQAPSRCTSVLKQLVECSLSSPIVCLDYSSSFGSFTSLDTSNETGDEQDDSSDEEDEEDNEVADRENETTVTKETDGTKSEEEEDWLCFWSNSPSSHSQNSSQFMEGRIFLGEGYLTQEVLLGAKTSGVQGNGSSEKQEDSLDESCTNSRPSSCSKKVHFDENHLVELIEFEDDSESQMMRETYWEVFARDRSRFNERISQTEKLLTPVLSKDHRSKVCTQMEAYSAKTDKILAKNNSVPHNLSISHDAHVICSNLLD